MLKDFEKCQPNYEQRRFFIMILIFFIFHSISSIKTNRFSTTDIGAPFNTTYNTTLLQYGR